MAQQAIARRPVVLLLGDSLTERAFEPPGGWGAALAHALARRADVANRGLSGWNSRWARRAARRLCRGALGLPPLSEAAVPAAADGTAAGDCKARAAPAAPPGTCASAAADGALSPSSAAPAPPPPPAPQAPRELLFATVWFGANDAALPDRGGKAQHVPVDEYARNLEAIAREAIAAAAEANAAAAEAADSAASSSSPTTPPRPVRLLVITPPPVGDLARVAHQRQRMAECGDPRLLEYEGRPLEEGPLPDRTLEASRAYAAAALEVARRLREEFAAAADCAAAAAAAGVEVIVAAVDLHAALSPAVLEADAGWGRGVFADGLHFTGEGASLVGRLLQEAVERPAAEGGLGLGPLQGLPAHLPLWDRLAAPGWEAALDEFFA